jgi:hypothetical protein
MSYNLQVYTADESLLRAPKEALKRYFIPLGSKHNYGSCYEFVCWLKTPCMSKLDKPYLSLIYNFEMKMCKPCGAIDIKDAIIQLKSAIKIMPSTLMYKNYRLHSEYMVGSAKMCLDQLLLEYSWWSFQNHMAQKIKDKWSWHYWTPTSPICQRIRLRQLDELNQELSNRTLTSKNCGS